MLLGLYILGMTNKRRSGRYYTKELGRHKLSRRDLLAIEKILRIYADAYEKKHVLAAGGNPVPPQGRRTMPRKYIDMHVTLRGERADSVKFLRSRIRRTRYLDMQCGQAIIISISPLHTVIYAQINYATGNELKTMQLVVSKIEKFIETREKSLLNICTLVK